MSPGCPLPSQATALGAGTGGAGVPPGLGHLATHRALRLLHAGEHHAAQLTELYFFYCTTAAKDKRFGRNVTVLTFCCNEEM